MFLKKMHKFQASHEKPMIEGHLGIPVADGDDRKNGVTSAVPAHDAAALACHHVPDAQTTIG